MRKLSRQPERQIVGERDAGKPLVAGWPSAVRPARISSLPVPHLVRATMHHRRAVVGPPAASSLDPVCAANSAGPENDGAANSVRTAGSSDQHQDQADLGDGDNGVAQSACGRTSCGYPAGNEQGNGG
jgi:hypothetical protein